MAKEPLRFKNGKFKILLLGDIHEKYDTSGEKDLLKIEDMQNLVGTAVTELKPDLAVYLGDNCTADTTEEMRETISRIVKPVAKENVPMTFVYGNHDRECNVSLKTQTELYNEYENSYFYNADDSISGYGNHYLLLKSENSGKNIFNLWFIDSLSSGEIPEISYYDKVHQDQIQWYERTAQKIKEENGELLPALLFQHIPVIEEYELTKEAKWYHRLFSAEPQIKSHNKRYILKKGVKGYMSEAPGSPDVNSGQFASWKKVGDIIGAFFGHDHLNDFEGVVDGIYLAQNKTAGFRPYTDGGRSGVRLVTLYENDLKNFDSEMYHFKDFGLKSKSLEFYESHISDRQDFQLKVAGIALGIIGITGALSGVLTWLIK